MKLVLSNHQFYPVEPGLVLVPISSGWNLQLLKILGTPIYNFMKNSPQSGLFQYKLKPKSSFSNYTSQGYTNLKVRGQVIVPDNDPEWLQVNSEWFPVANYTSLNQSSYKDISIMISPPLSISQGNHLGKVKFHIEGVKNNVTEILSNYEIPVELRVFEEGYYFNPSNFSFYYNPEVPAQSQTLTMGGENWTVTAPYGLLLQGPNVMQLSNGSYRASGSGIKTFQLQLSNAIGVALNGEEETTLPVVANFPGQNYTLPVQVIQTGAVYPTQTNFTIQSGVVDHYQRTIHVTRLGDFTVNASASLGFEILNTEAGRKVKVYVLDPTMFGPGFYLTFVNLVFADSTYTVQITIKVSNDIDVGIIGLDAVFTDSMDDFLFNSANINSYIAMELAVVGNTNTMRYQFPFFKGVARKNIGKALKNFINYNLNNLTGTNPFGYFTVTIKEVKNNVELNNYVKSNVPFVKGYKPKITANKAILQHNTFSRFTPKSFALINVYSLTGVFDYQIKKNNVQVHSVAQDFGYLKTIKLNFADYNAVPGDVFDFVLITGTEVIKKSFIIYPQTENTINVVYVDSFGLHSCLNFTGMLKDVNSEFGFKLENYIDKTFMHTRKYVEKESVSIKLNTGFILKSQALEIAELMKSPKAWVVVNNDKVLEIIPKTDKLEEVSNDNYLYNYSVEFEINKKEYAQNYNF